MKTIQNKQTDILKEKKEKEDIFCNYADLIGAIINVPPQGGYQRVDIKTRDKIEQIVKDSNGELQFEDTDFEYLKKLVLNMSWNTRHKDLIMFVEDFEKL